MRTHLKHLLAVVGFAALLLTLMGQVQVVRRAAGGLIGALIYISDVDGTPDAILNVSGSPTLSSCGDGALGTGSSNTSGEVTGTTQTACTLTFSTAFPGNDADCFVSNITANRGNVSASSATAFTVSNLTGGDDFLYFCIGR